MINEGQRLEARFRKLACFDFDGTLVDGFPPEAPFIWRILHEHFRSPRDEVASQRERFFSGECTYREWFEHDIRLLRAAGADRSGMLDALAGLEPMDGVREVVRILREAGWYVAVLSGSVDVAFDRFFPDNPFHAVLMNRFHFAADGRLSGGEATPFDVAGKADGLRHLARLAGVEREDTVFVGDSYNDRDAALAAGTSIAFNCRDPRLSSVATHTIPWPARDLRAILPFLGFS